MAGPCVVGKCQIGDLDSQRNPLRCLAGFKVFQKQGEAASHAIIQSARTPLLRPRPTAKKLPIRLRAVSRPGFAPGHNRQDSPPGRNLSAAAQEEKDQQDREWNPYQPQKRPTNFAGFVVVIH